MTAPPVPIMLAGMRVQVGLTYAEVTPTWDTETYSEAGFTWYEEKQRWGAPPGTSSGSSPGLGVCGAAVYTEHPTADVLTLTYDLKDGSGKQRWRPGMPMPQPLIDHILGGGLLEAHNTAFERWVNINILAPKYGFPIIPPENMRCSMVKARAHSLPGKLGKIGEVLKLPVQKNKDGERLIKKFSVPRNPTKTDARRRILLQDDLADAERLYGYCDDDVDAESMVSMHVPDLPPEELRYWQVDQQINARGVAVDIDGVNACIAIIEQCHVRYNAEMLTLTDGVVPGATKLDQLKAWMATRGVHVDSLDEENLTAQLARTDLPPDVYRALEIRAAVGSASVKKVFAMRNQTTRAGRMHDLYSCHAAHTGRPTGNGPQPTNLPNSGPKVHKCDGGHWFGTHLDVCPFCAAMRTPKVYEWNPAAVEQALTIIKCRSLELLEMYFGPDPMYVLSGCLRGLFVAADGMEMICSDYTAIEAVVAACLANEPWRIEVFRTHGKIYEASASAMFGVPLDEMLRYREETGEHHQLRKLGKIAELACFTRQTQVLTDRGYIDMVDVTTDDKLWDGVEWISHGGVVPRGVKMVVRLDGTEMTPAHKINCGPFWPEAKRLVSNANILSQCLATGSENLPLSGTYSAKLAASKTSSCNATAAESRTQSTFAICEKVHRRVAPLAALKPVVRHAKAIGNMTLSFLISSIELVCSTGITQRKLVALRPRLASGKITVVAVFECIRIGSRIRDYFSSTQSLLVGGITRNSKWIEPTTTAAMSRVISDSFRRATTQKINAVCNLLKNAFASSKPVFDIAHAGPRNRFTIKTNSGHLLVHNCGFGGWINSAKAFGMPGDDVELKKNILAWRKASPAIEFIWGGQWDVPFSNNRKQYLYGLEGMWVKACSLPGITCDVTRKDGQASGASFLFRADQDILYLLWHGERLITYHKPRMTPAKDAWRGLSLSYEGWNSNALKGPIGWIRVGTWGSRVFENLTQAVANRIFRAGQIALCENGYPVVMHTYDENCSEVPEGFGSIDEYERLMVESRPEWAKDWPIRAAGGWRGKRYRK